MSQSGSILILGDKVNVYRKNSQVKFSLPLSACTVREQSIETVVQIVCNTVPQELKKEKKSGKIFGFTLQLFVETREVQKTLRD